MSLERKLRGFLSKQDVSFVNGKQSFISDCIDPSCGKEGHMYIRKRDGKTICFKCGNTWDWRALVSTIAGVSFREAYSTLHGEGAGDVIDKALDVKFEFAHGEEDLDQKLANLKPTYLGPDFVPFSESPAALAYLEERGVTDMELCARYDLRYQAFMHAVVFPIKKGEQVYGWQARKINPENPKLRLYTMPGFDKSKFLLNQNGIIGKERIILVEGPFDCLHVDLDGIGAVASLGKTVSLDQIRILIESEATEIYLGLDKDAFNEVYDIVDRLSLKKKVFRIRPPRTRKDFGECTPQEVRQSIKEALSTKDMFLELYFKEE